MRGIARHGRPGRPHDQHEGSDVLEIRAERVKRRRPPKMRLAAKQVPQVDRAARHPMSLRHAGGLSVNSPMNEGASYVTCARLSLFRLP